MKTLWVDAEIVVPFVAALTGLRPDFGKCRCMAVLNGKEEMIAGLVFNNWDEKAGVIEVSAAATSPRWATRNVLKAALKYCFETAGCQMVIARHSECNKPARRLWKALGAQEYIIPRLRGRDTAESIATLTDDAWAKSKFMRQKNG